MREVLEGILNKEDLLYKTAAIRLAAYEGASLEKLSPRYTETLFYMLLGGLSSAHQGAEEEKIAHLMSIKGGNGLLLEKMAELLEDKIHLKQALISVSKDASGGYALQFKEGQKVKADILILAMPCSVYESIAFESGIIPQERLKAIKNVQYSAISKIIVPLSSTPLKRKAFMNDRLVSFFSGAQTLTLYYTGQSSRFNSETILKTYQEDRPMLEMGLGELCPPLLTPILARDASFEVYSGPVGYSWPNDPFAKGAYSYIAAGQESVLTATNEEQGEVVKSLFAPLNRSLYFVGEHASILSDVSGTMEAACESGERIARMIVKAHKQNR